MASSQGLSLQEAIETGWKNRTELKTRTLQVQLERQQDDKIRASWLPQVNASADFRYNAILQKSVLPLGEFGIPGIAPDVTSTVAFGVPFTSTAGLEATQKIIDPVSSIDKKIHANSVEAQLNALEKQKKEIRYAITEAYYFVLYQKERLQLANDAVQRAQVNLENGQTRLQAGTALKSDTDRLLLDLSNTQLSARKARQDYDFSIEQLKHQMNVDKDATITIDETIKTMLKNMSPPSIPQTLVNSAIRDEQIAMRGNQWQAKKSLKRYIPTVSAYGNLSLLALNEAIYPFSYIGLRAFVPLYDGKLAKKEAADYQLKQQINLLTMEKLQTELDFEIRSAQKALEQARMDLEESEKNITLARQLYATDQFRLEKGNIVASDLKNAEFTLLSSENNYMAAAYTYLITALKLKKLIEE
jgi:outer membrane protein TolC